MSTKIHHGYQLTPRNLTLQGAQNIVFRVMAPVRAKAKSIIVEWIAARTVTKLDLAAAGVEACKRSPLSEAWGEFEERAGKVRRTQERDPEIDISFTVCLIPRGDRTLALVYTEQDEFRKIWERTPGVAEYAYWNNSDRPKFVSEAHWKKREEDWDDALKMNSGMVPSQVGFSMEAFGSYNTPFPEAGDVLKRIGRFSFQKRVESVARRILRDKFFKAESKDKKIDPSQAIEILTKFEDWAENAGQAELKAKREELALKLKRNLTFEDIVERDPSPPPWSPGT